MRSQGWASLARQFLKIADDRVAFINCSDVTAIKPCSKSAWRSSLLNQQASYASKGRKGKEKADEPQAEQTFDAKETERAMQRALDYLLENFKGMRTGRPSEGMLDNLKVEAYGDNMPLKSVGAVSVRDAHTLVVSVFDPSILKAVEKAIRVSNLGLNPKVENEEILVPVPKPTRESLNAVGKMLKDEGESAKVSVRQARKSAMDTVKAFDDESVKKRMEKQVQALTDKFNKQIEENCSAKQKELAAAL